MSSQIPYSIASNAKEFLAGMVAEQASYYKDKAKAAKDVENFVKNVDSDLRNVYDKYIPNVHVVDVVTFTNIVANRLTLNPEKFLDPGSVSPSVLNFGDPNSSEYKGLYNTIKTSVANYHANLISRQDGVTNPIKELNKLSERLFSRTVKLDNPVSARVLGAEFSNRIVKVFGNRAVMAAIDSGLGSSETRFVFFSSSFNSITDSIRKEVYVNIQAYLKEILGPDMLAKFAVGSIVNTGHAALISDTMAFVNTPAFAQVLYGVGSGRSKRLPPERIQEAAELFKTESRILENNIRVDKSFISSDSGYGILLSLGVTFTNIEDAELNGFRGIKFEKTSVSSFKIQKPAELTRSASKKMQDTLMRLVFRMNPLLGQSSRNVLDFVKDSITSALVGKKTFTEKTSKVVSTTKQVKVTSIKQKSPTKVSAGTLSGRQVPLNTLVNKPSTLASLHAILDSALVQRVKENMGDGTRRDVLNLRSGRFAESAKVERLSESRAGMITAFYTYMKNPYATFSDGGRQGYPKSRDPKLLISKSIREIAATQVGNRMRAVVV